MAITQGRGPLPGDLPQTIRDHFASVYPRPTGGILSEFSSMLSAGTLTKSERRRLLKKAGAEQTEYRKAEIDLVLSYLRAAVESEMFGAEERKAFEVLKELFEIVEGEFKKCRAVELATMLNAQLEKILEDDVIDPKEDEYQAALQDALDLGYDEYMTLCRRAFEHASLRLEEQLASASDVETRQQVQRKINQLLPLIRLAQLQARTLGALY